MKTRLLILSILLTALLLSSCSSLASLNPAELATATIALPSATPIQPTPLPTATQLPTATTIPPTHTPLTPQVVANPRILFFQMSDFQNGWAYGETYLLHTEDGGLTWYDITPAGLTELGSNVTGYYFMNAGTAWLVIMGADPMLVELYHTTNGGLSWTNNSIPFDGGVMQFLDAQHGFVLVPLGAAAGSEAVAIYQTADGGVTWTQVFTNAPDGVGASDSLPFSGQKSGMTFLDATHGWVSGNVPQPAYSYLYATRDGGISWAQQKLILPSGFETAMLEVNAPVFYTPMDGVLPVRLQAEPPSFVFYVTHDAGQTWTSTFPLNFNGRYAMSSLLDFWLWDGGSSMYASHDSGITWDPVSTNIDATDKIVQFQFVDVNNGWLLTSESSDRYVFYRTTDGGKNWIQVTP